MAFAEELQLLRREINGLRTQKVRASERDVERSTFVNTLRLDASDVFVDL